MPFTPSHAVVALPFLRGPLLPAAIAVGAMAPDLPLFVRSLPLTYGMTHSFAWLPVTVVVAAALLLLWRGLLRPAVRELSPGWLGERLPGEWDDGALSGMRSVFAFRGRGAVSLLGIVLLLLALALGVASHIAWDWFTHEGRLGTTVLPALDAMWGPLFGYKWLQYGSSVVGLLIIGVWAMRWLRTADRRPLRRTLPTAVRVSWWASLPLFLIVAWVGGMLAFGPFTADFTPQHLAYRVLPTAVAVWGAITVVLCIVVDARRARTGPRSGA